MKNFKILYIYDFNFKVERKELNRARRLFYYYLNKFFGNEIIWASKSALILDKKHEKEMDGLLRRFRSCLLAFKTPISKLKRLK